MEGKRGIPQWGGEREREKESESTRKARTGTQPGGRERKRIGGK